MPKKQNKENKNIDKNDEEKSDKDVEKIGLKNQKDKKGKVENEKTDSQWEKVESIFNAAKEAYKTEGPDFDSVIEGLIETLQNMREEEAGRNGLGGLGVGGPEMDIPEGEQEGPEESGENKNEQ